MSHLIDSYSPTADSSQVSDGFQTVLAYNLEYERAYAWSIIVRSSGLEEGGINKKILDSLDKIELLSDNWDEAGSLSPNKNTLQLAKTITLFMEAIGQEIFSIAPGPHGEIMLDFRNKEKSFEVLIYPDKMKYVKFSNNEAPSQGAFTPDIILSELITWLNK